MTYINGALPPALDRNQYWQELNARLNIDWKPSLTPGDQFPSKVAATIAGGDLPDLVQLLHRGVPQLPGVLEHFFADLTPYLSGDAVKKYPALANIPTVSWKSAAYGGKIYGVPVHRPVVGGLMMARADLLPSSISTADITTMDDFLELCRAVSNPQKNRWALSSPATARTFVDEVYRVPNVWEENGGTFTSAYETEQTKQSIDHLARIWRDGLFHPDSFSAAGPTQNTWFYSGTVALLYGQVGFWTNARNLYKDIAISAIPLVGTSGEKGRKILGSGIVSMTSIKKTDRGRVEEMLRILDWLSSPVGTEECLFMDYGIEGHTFTWDVGGPGVTGKWAAEVLTTNPQYLSDAPVSLYNPGLPEDTRAQHQFAVDTVPGGIADPTLGLYSESDVTKGATLRKQMTDMQNDIVQGRKSLSTWDEAVQTWRRNGGDAIRREYEADFERSRPS